MSRSNSDPALRKDTRPSLLNRVRAGENSPSWPEFQGQYRSLVYTLARRSGLRPEDAEEVTHDVFKRAAEKLHEFESNPEKESLRGWLMKLTRWRIADRYARSPTIQRRRTRGQDDRGIRGAPPSPRAAERTPLNEKQDMEWPGLIFDAACQRVARRARKKHYQVFNLYVRQQCHILRVAREMGINPAKIYAICHRIAKRLKLEVSKLQRQPA